MKKVRRRLVEERTREFVDACDFILDHRLLLWSPSVDRAAQSLIRAVRKTRERSRAWSGEKKK